MNKLFGTTIGISDSIFEHVRAEILARALKRVQVKGRKTEFMIYELLAFRASDDPELRVRDRDEQLSAMTWQASQQIEAGDFAAGGAHPPILFQLSRPPPAQGNLEENEEKRATRIPPTPPATALRTHQRT